MAQALVQPEEVPDFTNRERDQLEFMRRVCNYAMGGLLSASFVAVSANTLDIPEFTRRYLAVNACAFFLYALPTAALAHSVSRGRVWFNIVSATVLVLSLYTVAPAFALIQVFGNVPPDIILPIGAGLITLIITIWLHVFHPSVCERFLNVNPPYTRES